MLYGGQHYKTTFLKHTFRMAFCINAYYIIYLYIIYSKLSVQSCIHIKYQKSHWPLMEVNLSFLPIVPFTLSLAKHVQAFFDHSGACVTCLVFFVGLKVCTQRLKS